MQSSFSSVIQEQLRGERLVLLAGRAMHRTFTDGSRHCRARLFSNVPLSRCHLAPLQSNENQGDPGKLFNSNQGF